MGGIQTGNLRDGKRARGKAPSSALQLLGQRANINRVPCPHCVHPRRNLELAGPRPHFLNKKSAVGARRFRHNERYAQPPGR